MPQVRTHTDKKRRKYYMDVLPIKGLKKCPYQPRKLKIDHIASLRASIDTIGLMNPILVAETEEDGNSRFEILDGQHRVEALRELDYKVVEAKVYVYIDERTKRDICIEANEGRKPLNAGEEFRAETERFEEMRKTLEKKAPGPVAEEQVLNELRIYRSSERARIILGKIVYNLCLDPNAEIAQHVSDAQVPKRLIEAGDEHVVTAGNLFFFLKRICRGEPITADELKKGKKDLRKVEYDNVRRVTDFLAKELIQPYLKIGDFDTVVGICRRHPFEATAAIVAQILIRTGSRSPSFPAYDSDIDWGGAQPYLEKLKKVQWRSPEIVLIRSVSELQNVIYPQVF